MSETTSTGDGAPQEIGDGWLLTLDQPEETVVLSETQNRTQLNPPVLRAEKQINGSLVTVEATSEEQLQTRIQAVEENVQAFKLDPVGAATAPTPIYYRLGIGGEGADPLVEEVEVDAETVITPEGRFTEEEWSARGRTDTIVTADGQSFYSGVGDTEKIDEALVANDEASAVAENEATTDPFGDTETQQVVYSTADALDSPGQSAGGTLIIPAEAESREDAVAAMTETSQQAENQRVLAAQEAAERDQASASTFGPTQKAMAEEHAARLQAQAEAVEQAKEEGVSEDEATRRAREAGAAATSGEEAEPHATEGAIEAADELGVDLNEVEGTGKGGRITKADVEQHANG
jgi:hypothetical protein